MEVKCSTIPAQISDTNRHLRSLLPSSLSRGYSVSPLAAEIRFFFGHGASEAYKMMGLGHVLA
jgi:hypothetical protein